MSTAQQTNEMKAKVSIEYCFLAGVTHINKVSMRGKYYLPAAAVCMCEAVHLCRRHIKETYYLRRYFLRLPHFFSP